MNTESLRARLKEVHEERAANDRLIRLAAQSRKDYVLDEIWLTDLQLLFNKRLELTSSVKNLENRIQEIEARNATEGEDWLVGPVHIP